jgi:hypothetical protein
MRCTKFQSLPHGSLTRRTAEAKMARRNAQPGTERLPQLQLVSIFVYFRLGRFDFQSDRVVPLDASAVKGDRLLGFARQSLAVCKYRPRGAVLFANSFINQALLQIGNLLVGALFDGALDERQGYRQRRRKKGCDCYWQDLQQIILERVKKTGLDVYIKDFHIEPFQFLDVEVAESDLPAGDPYFVHIYLRLRIVAHEVRLVLIIFFTFPVVAFPQTRHSLAGKHDFVVRIPVSDADQGTELAKLILQFCGKGQVR